MNPAKQAVSVSIPLPIGVASVLTGSFHSPKSGKRTITESDRRAKQKRVAKRRAKKK